MPPSHRFIKTRLALMMFLQYVVMGAVWPVMSLYLRQVLGLSGTQTGTVLALSAVGAFVAPAVGACVADRLISAERLLSLCHFGAAAFMGLILRQTGFETVLPCYLGYAVCMGSTVALTNAIAFHHAPQGQRRFGNIRVWGTIGWVTVAWGFGTLWLQDLDGAGPASHLPGALRFSVWASLVLGLYGLSLPRVDKRIQGPIRLLPRESMRVFMKPQVLLMAAAGYLVGTVDRYYYFGMALYLKDLGYTEGQIMPMMSAGQITEMVAMCLLAWFLARLGTKRTLLLGLLAEIGRFSAFAFGSSNFLVLMGNACHGLAFAFFFTSLYITIDSYCDTQSRTGLHQLFTIATSSLGALTANLLGGWCLDHFVRASTQTQPDYRGFWLVPTVISCVCFVLIALFFKEPDDSDPLQEVPRTG